MKSLPQFSLICLLFLVSCGPKISTSILKTYPGIDYKQDIVVLDLDQEAPPEAEVLGTVKVGDTGFTSRANGQFDVVLGKAKLEARKAGGNAIKITQHLFPGFNSTSHRITCDILRVDDPESLLPARVEVSEHPDYAMLYFFRSSGAGALVSYDVHLGDSTVCRMGPNTTGAIKVESAGRFEVWARTESKVSLPLDIELGKDYYIECSVSMGAFVGRPAFSLCDRAGGKSAYESILRKKSK